MTTEQRVHAYHDLVDGQITLARYRQLMAEPPLETVWHEEPLEEESDLERDRR